MVVNSNMVSVLSARVSCLKIHITPVPFPPVAEPPTPPPGSTPSRSRIPLTRSRLNSLDKTYTGLGFRRTSGETQRPGMSQSFRLVRTAHDDVSVAYEQYQF